MRLALFVLTCAAASVPRMGAQNPTAQTPPTSSSQLKERIDSYFAPIVANHDFQGVVLVARGHHVLVERAYGLADPELGVQTSTADRYLTASVTKTFTAAAIAILAERGVLHLEDTLVRFLPSFPNADHITLLQLLRHEAGLDNPDYRDALVAHIDLPELVRRIGARKPLFAPGADNRYSNAGFNILARVVEVASGLTYDEFLRRTIFTPLGMGSTGNFWPDTIVPGRVRGFIPGPMPAGVIPAPASDIGFNIGSGSITSTARDLYRWALALHQNRLFCLSCLRYPYGWGTLENGHDRGIWQTGLENGFTSSLALWLTDSLYVVVLGNVEAADWTRWSTDVAELARGRSVSKTMLLAEMRTDSSSLARFVGEYRGNVHTLSIARHDHSLWLFLDGWPVPKYLAPVARDAFRLRSDFGTIVFDTTGAGASRSLKWKLDSGSGESYTRRESP